MNNDQNDLGQLESSRARSSTFKVRGMMPVELVPGNQVVSGCVSVIVFHTGPKQGDLIAVPI